MPLISAVMVIAIATFCLVLHVKAADLPYSIFESSSSAHLEETSLRQAYAVPLEQRSRINRAKSASRNGKSRKNQRDVEEPIEVRAERFFDRGGIIDYTFQSAHYRVHEKFFKNALSLCIKELGGLYRPDDDCQGLLKTRFMEKVRGYHHHEMLTKGTEKYRREDGLDMTLEEFDMVRKYFLNQNPPDQGPETERKRKSNLRNLYRKELKDPAIDKERVYRKLEKHGWTLEDIKAYVLPPVPEIREYLDYIRSKKANRSELAGYNDVTTEFNHANLNGRIDFDDDIDLNISQDEDENYGDALDLKVVSENACDSIQFEEDHTNEEDMPFNDTFHAPFPGAYEGNLYRAYPDSYDAIYGDE